MSGGRKQAQPAGGRPLDGNTKGLPTFGNGVEAPRLVVFEVINLQAIEGGSPWSKITEKER